jgi:hypothetical protein
VSPQASILKTSDAEISSPPVMHHFCAILRTAHMTRALLDDPI